jgi:hypothetical protein
MYDIVGDIHGFYDVLTLLLKKLGYTYDGISWGHPDRKVLFVGDYIDRGPASSKVLHLVRQMVENDQAIALMGNHELNAILFHETAKSGGHIRPHSLKNLKQHAQTLLQFANLGKGQEMYEDYIEWFKTLPLYFENEKIRAVHASWHHNSINALKALEDRLNEHPDFILNAGTKDHELHSISENLLKGVELPLPNGNSFKDKDGHTRNEMRVKWWKNPEVTPVEEYGFGADLSEYEGTTVYKMFENKWHYSDDKPVFFGHYWLGGSIDLQTEYVCCLDYSIGKKDRLAAYRYEGENSLQRSKISYVSYGEMS